MAKNISASRRWLGWMIFFCVYLLLTAAAVAGLLALRQPLEQKLTEYEQCRLEHRSAAVFEELFSQPDWERLYEMAGIRDADFEGKTEFAAYMKERCADAKLTCQEVVSEAVGVHRYQICSGKDKVAAFTMKNTAPEGAEYPQWTMGDVTLFFDASVDVTVEKQPEQTVYINGKPLDDTYTIRTVATIAEDYLPEGVHGHRMEQQYVAGLWTQPQVQVKDADGQLVALTRDPDTGVYSAIASQPAQMTEAEETAAREAAVADAKFSMRKITAAALGNHFDSQSLIYQQIVSNPMFIQGHKSASVDENAVQVTDFCRYGDAVFSARVKLTLHVLRKDDTTKLYPLDKTYFFRRGDDGRYLVFDYTNERVTERMEQVRVTFMGDAPVSLMVDQQATTVTPPPVEGDGFLGWGEKTLTDGVLTFTVRITPEGTVLGELKPMTLYGVYVPEQAA